MVGRREGPGEGGLDGISFCFGLGSLQEKRRVIREQSGTKGRIRNESCLPTGEEREVEGERRFQWKGREAGLKGKEGCKRG